LKEKDAVDTAPHIEKPEYQGPDRRDADPDTDATITSVRLSFDNDGSSVWKAATDLPQRRESDETVRLLAALNEEATQDEDDSDPGDTVGHRTLMAFGIDDE